MSLTLKDLKQIVYKLQMLQILSLVYISTSDDSFMTLVDKIVVILAFSPNFCSFVKVSVITLRRNSYVFTSDLQTSAKSAELFHQSAVEVVD